MKTGISWFRLECRPWSATDQIQKWCVCVCVCVSRSSTSFGTKNREHVSLRPFASSAAWSREGQHNSTQNFLALCLLSSRVARWRECTRFKPFQLITGHNQQNCGMYFQHVFLPPTEVGRVRMKQTLSPENRYEAERVLRNSRGNHSLVGG